MRRLLVLATACAAAASCSSSNNNAVDRGALTAQIVESVRGTVGADGTACVEDFLNDRTAGELDALLNGGNDSLNREFTDVVVACVDN